MSNPYKMRSVPGQRVSHPGIPAPLPRRDHHVFTQQRSIRSRQLTQHSADVIVIAEQIQDSMRTMRVKLESLQGTWKGAAAGQYVQLHHEWEVAQEKVRVALQDISTAVARAGGAYSAVEQQVTAVFRP